MDYEYRVFQDFISHFNIPVIFQSDIPVTMKFDGREVMCAEINFLCVHKSLRAKRLAPILIKEITRRVNRCNIWQAVYTAGALIPTPITGATYWHRSLNP